MSYEEPTHLDHKTHLALSDLLADVQPVIDQHLKTMDGRTIAHALKNYRKFLKIDLVRDFEQAQEMASQDSSAFDDLLKDLPDQD